MRNNQGGRKMQDTLLLDGRTQSLVEEYVPEGEILDGIVSFFSIFVIFAKKERQRQLLIVLSVPENAKSFSWVLPVA